MQLPSAQHGQLLQSNGTVHETSETQTKINSATWKPLHQREEREVLRTVDQANTRAQPYDDGEKKRFCNADQVQRVIVIQLVIRTE